MKYIALAFSVLIIYSSSVFASDSAASFQMPSYEEFLNKLPQYDYECKLNELIKKKPIGFAEKFVKELSLIAIPSDESINQTLQEKHQVHQLN